MPGGCKPDVHIRSKLGGTGNVRIIYENRNESFSFLSICDGKSLGVDRFLQWSQTSPAQQAGGS